MKYILITCDTEIGELGQNVENAFEIFIEGKVENQEVGVKLINDIASKYNATVEHFVDVYPFEKIGENKFKNLCLSILDSGHKIGLHTHPSVLLKKRFMWQYSLQEQIEIVRLGKEKIKEWTGISVISHRAGGYGADDNTLLALKVNNILIDSSFFYSNPNCKIKYPYKNKVDFYKGIYEIPVTVYEKYFQFLFFKKKYYQKLDFRYGSSTEEIIQVIKNLPDNSVAIIFLHSFNFLNLPYDFKKKKYGKISVNYHLIKSFDNLLASLSKINDVVFTTSEYLYRNKLITNDLILSLKVKIFPFFIKKLKSKIENFLGYRGNI